MEAFYHCVSIAMLVKVQNQVRLAFQIENHRPACGASRQMLAKSFRDSHVLEPFARFGLGAEVTHPTNVPNTSAQPSDFEILSGIPTKARRYYNESLEGLKCLHS